MVEVGEKFPGGKNFWWGETHTVKGLLTLATMLDGNYSKKLVDELINVTYKKLLDCSSIQSNVAFPFHSTSPKMEKLYTQLTEYSDLVNPYGNKEFKLKDPIQYLDTVDVTLAMQEGRNHYTGLILSTNSTEAMFKQDDKEGWFYETFVPIQRKRMAGYVNIGHYYLNGRDGRPVDEVVRLYYKANDGSYDEHPDDIDLRISLKTGLAWETYKEEQAEPATDEQIEIVIAYT